MAKIVVTGADGQLGCELIALAGTSGKDHGWYFTDADRMDITDRDIVAGVFRRERPDVVVNCAAWTDVDGAEKNREGAFRVNAAGPEILAEAVLETGASLIHVSTDFVFDGRKRTPYTEDDLAEPLNVYGETKLAGERAVAGSGCNGAIVRTSWLYSPFGRNFVKSILGAARGGGELRVVDDQLGSPTAAGGLAAAIVAMIPQLLANPRRAQIYHYCDSGVASRYELARETVKLAGVETAVIPVRSSEYATAAKRPEYSALDTTKIKRDFGIVPRPWQDALAEVLVRIQEIDYK